MCMHVVYFQYLLSPLSCAGRYGHLQVVRLLLSRDTNLDYGDEVVIFEGFCKLCEVVKH